MYRKKWTRVGLVTVILAVIILGYGGICKKKSSDNDVILTGSSPAPTSSASTGDDITIRGTFTGGAHADKSWFDWLDRIISSPLYALDADQVTKVIAVSYDGSWFTTEVADDGSFSLGVEKDQPLGLVFAGASNNYLGYLTLQNGIDSLPLSVITDSNVTVIDLQTLSSLGLIVEPGHNPIGSELSLTVEEQAAIAQGDDFFASVVKNMDADGNGIIDVFDNKFYSPFVMYFIDGGDFDGSNLTPTVTTPASIANFRFCFGVWDQAAISFPDTVYFTGPAGSDLTNTPNEDPPNTYEQSASYGAPAVDDPAIPPAGQYTISYNDDTLTFDIPAQTSAVSNTVLAIPTVTLDGDDNIQKINWVYKLGDGAGATIDPRAIIQHIEIQISGDGTSHDAYPVSQADRLYNSGNLATATTEHILPTTSTDGADWSIDWSNVTNISTVYNDIYGNHYVVGWGINK